MLSHASVKPQPKAKDGLDSQDEDVSSADEKKNGLRDLIKRLPRPASMRHRVKDNNSASHTDSQPNGGTPESLHYKIQLEVS